MNITKCGNGPSAASGFACNGRASGLVCDGKLLPQSQDDHQKPPNPKTQLAGDITQPQSKHGPRHKWDLPPLWARASYSDPFHRDLPSPRTQQTSTKGVKRPLSFLRQCQAFHTRWAVGLLAGQERLGAHRQPPHSGHALAVGANPFEVPPKATWRIPLTRSPPSSAPSEAIQHTKTASAIPSPEQGQGAQHPLTSALHQSTRQILFPQPGAFPSHRAVVHWQYAHGCLTPRPAVCTDRTPLSAHVTDLHIAQRSWVYPGVHPCHQVY